MEKLTNDIDHRSLRSRFRSGCWRKLLTYLSLRSVTYKDHLFVCGSQWLSYCLRSQLHTELFKMNFIFHLVLLLLPVLSILDPHFANVFTSATPVDPSDVQLPPGWTQERLDTASTEELSALPPDVSLSLSLTFHVHGTLEVACEMQSNFRTRQS